MNTHARPTVNRFIASALSFGLALAVAVPAIAGPARPLAWTRAIASIFRVYASLPGFPFECTGWYLAAVAGTQPVSVYLTAGHCPTPLMVRTRDGFEDTLVLARLHSREAGADLTIAQRADPRSQRTFLALSPTPAQPGERALVAGYGEGTLTTTVVTVLPTCQRPFICFASPVYVLNGLSGSPVVSLRTGRVLGLLVASPPRQYPSDPYVIIATPAIAIRAALALVLPDLWPAVVHDHNTAPGR